MHVNSWSVMVSFWIIFFNWWCHFKNVNSTVKKHHPVISNLFCPSDGLVSPLISDLYTCNYNDNLESLLYARLYKYRPVFIKQHWTCERTMYISGFLYRVCFISKPVYYSLHNVITQVMWHQWHEKLPYMIFFTW